MEDRSKVLGIVWDTLIDTFEFDLSKVTEVMEGEKITKRKILSSSLDSRNMTGMRSFQKIRNVVERKLLMI